MSGAVSRRFWLGSACASGLALAAVPAHAVAALGTHRVHRVGLDAARGQLAQVLAACGDGDVVELAAGVHRGQVAVAPGRSVTLRGAGAGAVLLADGAHALGKAILVVQGDLTVENIEFRGARVPDGNGAGIRLDSGRLTVRRCRFADNEMGLLTSNDPLVTLDIEDSVFADAPRHPGLLHHLLYAGVIDRLTLTGCRFENGWRGHLVKSRARHNQIVCNLLRDGPEGGASYELELAQGGHNLVSGNLIVQGPNTHNAALVAVGYDADPKAEHGLVFIHNTLVNEGPAGARFLQLAAGRMPRQTSQVLANNVFAGRGTLPAAATGRRPVPVPLTELRDPSAGDYRLREPCAAPWRAQPLAPALQPRRELTLPLGSRQLPTGSGTCAGAWPSLR